MLNMTVKQTCVGFVLPVNDKGLPEIDAFLAISFDAIENMFTNNTIAKYAYVYMAQPLCQNVPPFCLACFGIDNKFKTEQVLSRWHYILRECKKRGITVVSFGGDGDSRLVKSMKISEQLFETNNELLPSTFSLAIPSKWNSWFLIQKPSSLSCVQDVVHIGVKLKSRLLKPSIILPMGNYVAGVFHIRMLQQAFGKDQHGLRERDLDHKDKQNFNAVLNIIRASPLLDEIPDAVATREYINVMQCVMDSYLNKSLDPLTRIEKIWHATLFLRYWRQWILLHPLYTLQDNFISSNSYVCTELNAHAILTLLITIRDHFKDQSASFQPWLLGSQSCEKIFRAARSMTSTFSTIINFGMLGLLRRLHRLQIQSTLQSESAENEIIYPQIQKHKNKEGREVYVAHSLNEVTNSQIFDAIMRSEKSAKALITKLGMAELLRENGKWDTIPAAAECCDSDLSDEEEEEEEEENEDCDENLLHTIVQEVCMEDPAEIEGDIDSLSSEFISSELKRKLQSSIPKLKKLPNDTVSMFTTASEDSQKSIKRPVISPFVQVKLGESCKTIFIRKTTAVWLFQEGERVSSDRLFRVRAKQPYSSDVSKQEEVNNESGYVPYISQTINLGNLCAFKAGDMWNIGKVLQFSKKGAKKKFQQYKECSVSVSMVDIFVLCSWCSRVSESSSTIYKVASQQTEHAFIPISYYICTLTRNSFAVIKGSCENIKSIMPSFTTLRNAVTDETFCISEKCKAFISGFLNGNNVTVTSVSHSKTEETLEETKTDSEVWTAVGYIYLHVSDKYILCNKQCKERWLNDKHMTCAQMLLKQQFPSVGGLNDTMNQKTKVNFQPLPGNSLQILHINDNHWASVSTMHCQDEDIVLYDSMYSIMDMSTKVLLAALVKTDKPSFKVKIANTKKQLGQDDCGLFAIAYITHIAFGLDPANCEFKQTELRDHLVQCFEDKKMSPFPYISKERRTNAAKLIEITVYCYCRCPNDGTEMVMCNSCEQWFHMKCANCPVYKNKCWFCKYCK